MDDMGHYKELEVDAGVRIALGIGGVVGRWANVEGSQPCISPGRHTQYACFFATFKDYKGPRRTTHSARWHGSGHNFTSNL